MSGHNVMPIKKNPTPYLHVAATTYWESIMKNWWTVFEWGSGSSTIWLSKRVAKVTSVEHRQGWYDEVVRAAKENEVSPYIMLVSLREYVDAINQAPYDWAVDGHQYDCVFVDGHQPKREACARAALDKIRDGGWLVLDDTYLSGGYGWALWTPIVKELNESKDWDGVFIRGRRTDHDGKHRLSQTSFYKKGKI